jgi:hypothetical protein
VEEGVPFCRHCKAPQIRVIVPEPVEIAAPSESEAGVSEQPATVGRVSIQWSKGFPAAAIGGLLSALSMFLPFGTLGIGMALAGYFCVVLYRRRTLGQITRGLGGKLGAVSGLLGFVMFAVWTAVQVAVFHAGGELREQLMKAIEQSAAGNPDPNVQTAVAQLKTPEGLAVMMGLGLFITLVGLVVLGSIGGAIAGAKGRRE